MLIQRMRDGTEGIMAKIIIGLICIVFALFGFGSFTSFLTPVAKVATVNGEDITLQEMEIAVERRRRMLQAQDTSFDEDQLREDILDSLITRAVLSQSAQELDLYFSDAALDAEIVTSPVFMLDGRFNAQQFQQVIAGAGFTPLSYRAEIRTDKLFDQMVTGIAQSAFVTDAEAERFSSLLSQRRDIAYIQVPAADFVEKVQITDDEIEAYYNSNLSGFVTDETVDIQYIELSRDDLADTYEIDELELQDYFDENKANYATDERRRVAHILVEVIDSSDYDAARDEADSIYQRLVAGEDFAQLAEEVSDDPGSSEVGGDLGFNQRGVFSSEFESVAFALEVDEISEPVETDFGFHLIKILGIEEGYTPELSDVRAEVEQRYRFMVTDDEFVSKSSRMAELLFENFSELESTAEALELQVQSTGLVKRDDDHVLMSFAGVVDAVFSPDVLLDGNNSDLIEVSEDLYIGLRVAEHQPSRARPLAEVKMDVTYILQREQAAELAAQEAQAIVAAIEDGSLAQFVADERGYTWQMVPSASRFEPDADPLVLIEGFKLPRPVANKEAVGTASYPNGDSLVLRVSRVSSSSDNELEQDELPGIKTSLAQQSGINDFDEYQESLRLEASLERVN